MSGYLFDTSALSAYLNEDHQYHAITVTTVDALPHEAAKFVSIVCLAELEYGVRLAEQQNSKRFPEFRARLEIIRQYASLNLTNHTSSYYAELKSKIAARMQRRPKTKMPRWIEDWIDAGSAKQLQIDENDLWICAQAMERDLIIVTCDADLRQITSYDPDLQVVLARN